MMQIPPPLDAFRGPPGFMDAHDSTLTVAQVAAALDLRMPRARYAYGFLLALALVFVQGFFWSGMLSGSSDSIGVCSR